MIDPFSSPEACSEYLSLGGNPDIVRKQQNLLGHYLLIHTHDTYDPHHNLIAQHPLTRLLLHTDIHFTAHNKTQIAKLWWKTLPNIPHLYMEGILNDDQFKQFTKNLEVDKLFYMSAQDSVNRHNPVFFSGQLISWQQFALYENWTLMSLLTQFGITEGMDLINPNGQNAWHFMTISMKEGLRPEYLHIFNYLCETDLQGLSVVDAQGKTPRDYVIESITHTNNKQIIEINKALLSDMDKVIFYCKLDEKMSKKAGKTGLKI